MTISILSSITLLKNGISYFTFLVAGCLNDPKFFTTSFCPSVVKFQFSLTQERCKLLTAWCFSSRFSKTRERRLPAEVHLDASHNHCFSTFSRARLIRVPLAPGCTRHSILETSGRPHARSVTWHSQPTK